MNERARAAAVVIVAAVLPYLSTLHDYFVQDDFGVVALLSQKPADAFFGWFTASWMDGIWGAPDDEIRPFAAVTYQVAAWWGAGSPVANHVMNIGLHAANAWLVVLIAGAAAGVSLPAAAFGGIVFALHPVHPEAVAWVTGRVDSLPAFFYLGSFLLYVRWRESGRAFLYVGALAMFFVALFTKQNTITLGLALLLYEGILARPRVRPSWAWLRPCVPFAALTAGYFLLRYWLLGEVLREGRLGALDTGLLTGLFARHLGRIAGGDPAWAAALPIAAGLAVAAVGAAFTTTVRLGTALRSLSYFLLVWIPLGIAPTLVAGYESPRHVYLAAVGWAVALAVLMDVLWEARPQRAARAAAVALGGLLLSGYGVRLMENIEQRSTRALVSRKVVGDLQREAIAAPEGTLFVLGAPVDSWEWALPFAAQPPFSQSDLTRRVRLVSPMRLHCCRTRWDEDTRRALGQWSADADAPIVILAWDRRTGALSRVTDADEPYLRALVTALMGTSGPELLDSGISAVVGTARPGPGSSSWSSGVPTSPVSFAWLHQ